MDNNESLGSMFIKRAKIEGKIRTIRVRSVQTRLVGLKSNKNLSENHALEIISIDSGVESLHKELNRIHRNYIKIDYMIDEIESQLDKLTNEITEDINEQGEQNV